MKAIIRWVYEHLPHFLRVWGNKVRAEVKQGILKQPRGRTGKSDGAPGFMEGHKKFVIEGHLGIKVLRVDGTEEIVDAGENTVTDAGVAYLVDDWDTGAAGITDFNYHAMGTGGGSPPPATSVTTLTTPVESRVAGTKSQPAANQIRTVATITASTARLIDEWGLFSASSGGTLWSVRYFTEVSLASGDSIEFTYTLTISSFTA